MKINQEHEKLAENKQPSVEQGDGNNRDKSRNQCSKQNK